MVKMLFDTITNEGQLLQLFTLICSPSGGVGNGKFIIFSIFISYKENGTENILVHN